MCASVRVWTVIKAPHPAEGNPEPRAAACQLHGMSASVRHSLTGLMLRSPAGRRSLLQP